jgi:hypothetical protein
MNRRKLFRLGLGALAATAGAASTALSMTIAPPPPPEEATNVVFKLNRSRPPWCNRTRILPKACRKRRRF